MVFYNLLPSSPDTPCRNGHTDFVQSLSFLCGEHSAFGGQCFFIQWVMQEHDVCQAENHVRMITLLFDFKQILQQVDGVAGVCFFEVIQPIENGVGQQWSIQQKFQDPVE